MALSVSEQFYFPLKTKLNITFLTDYNCMQNVDSGDDVKDLFSLVFLCNLRSDKSGLLGAYNTCKYKTYFINVSFAVIL